MIRPLFPLKPGEKTPLKANYKAQASSDSEVIRGWLKAGYNLGYCPSMGGETVIDLDKHGDKDGEEAFAEWEDSIGKHLPATLTVITPSGGKHLYYKGVAPYDKLGFLPGVDIICSKRYVVAPGSKTEKGVYTLNYPGEPAELPQWFIDEMNRIRRRPASKDPDKETISTVSLVVEPNSDANVAKAIGIIANWPEAFEGERNHSLFMLACELCKTGVTELRARELYREHGIDRLHYGADEAEWHEVAQTIRSAYTDKAAEFGANSHEAAIRMLDVTEEADVPDTWDGLVSLNVPQRKWLIQDWLSADPGSVQLFAGRGGTGKSLIALMLCHCLSTGEPWLGQEIKHRAKTLFVTCEDSRDEVARRVKKIAATYGDRAKDGSLVRIWSRQGKSNMLAVQGAGNVVAVGPFFAKLKAECFRHFGNDGGLLVLDTVADFSAVNENDRTQVSQFIKAILSDLATTAGISIMLLAHPNKAGASYSGSTAWEGSVRSSWFLRWKDQDKNKNDKIGGQLVLQLSKSNTSMAGKEIVLEYDQNFLPKVVEQAAEDTAVKDLIVRMIEEAVKEGNPFGRDKKSRRPILFAEIEDPVTGVKLDEKEIGNLVASLLAEGRIYVHKTNKNNFLDLTDGKTKEN